MLNNFTRADDEKSEIAVFVGVKGIDRTGDSMWESNFVGEAILDDDFSPYSEESQRFIMEMCEQMKNPINNGFIVNGSVDCWLEDFY
jgi:hypothetical protein